MARTNPATRKKVDAPQNKALKMRKGTKKNPNIHTFGKNNDIVCDTDARGFSTPENLGSLELVLEATEGFIPLWEKGTTLRWRFQEQSFKVFDSPAAAKSAVRKLLGTALLAWGDAAPIKFSERKDAWDFEIAMRDTDRCNINGCVLASAFFPDAGRHELKLYPILFEQSMEEQVETLCHEIGHTFGLRHFFAQLKETSAPSVKFGAQDENSIMNYGPKSKLTEQDKSDLKKLYQQVWEGQLKDINGTEIRLVKPFHTTGAAPDSLVAVGQVKAALQPPSASVPQSAP